MPQLTDTPIAVQHAMIGDVISTNNDSGWPYGAVVSSKKVGIKWVELRSNGGHLIRRCEVDTQVVVQRMKDTEAELAVKRDAFLAEQAEKMLVKMEGAYAEAEADIRKTFSENFVPTSSHLEALYAGVTLKKYAYRLREGLEVHAGEKTLPELFEMLAQEIEHKLIEREPGGRWSGGMTFSNAIEQNTGEVDRKLLRSIRFNFSM